MGERLMCRKRKNSRVCVYCGEIMFCKGGVWYHKCKGKKKE